MSNTPGPSFLDKKTVLAMILVGFCWIGWQYYMQKKYPNLYQKKAESTAEVNPTTATSGATTETAAPSTATPTSAGEDTVPVVQAETFTHFEDERMSFDISSKGMGLKDVVLKKYKDRKGEPIKFEPVNGKLPFETQLTGQAQVLDFAVERVGDLNFVGKAQVGDLTVTKSIEVDTQKYVLKTKVNINGSATAFLGLTTTMTIPMVPPIKSGLFTPPAGVQEFLVVSGGSDKREHITSKEAVEENYSKVSLAALGDQYFAQALIDHSEVIPEVRAKSNLERNAAVAEVNYASLGKSDGFTVSYDAFLGPKDLDLLTSVDEDLSDIIDYGWFSWLAKRILFFLKWFHEMVGNWGVAIILLTVSVRLLVMPLYVMSFKSMNKMKVIQPKMQALREKYKDDPQKMNMEVMALMRENKVNPMGGCLPMLLQFPVFIALYSVLRQSIELYQVPFFGWIQDLSLKDPYYVFPALMGITMFAQQRLTPTTLDPMQAKVLMFMPLIFIFFMINLPSGLALYMFVSALLGVGQQLLFMQRDETKTVAVK